MLLQQEHYNNNNNAKLYTDTFNLFCLIYDKGSVHSDSEIQVPGVYLKNSPYRLFEGFAETVHNRRISQK